jgi:hypothetical protein
MTALPAMAAFVACFCGTGPRVIVSYPSPSSPEEVSQGSRQRVRSPGASWLRMRASS